MPWAERHKYINMYRSLLFLLENFFLLLPENKASALAAISEPEERKLYIHTRAN